MLSQVAVSATFSALLYVEHQSEEKNGCLQIESSAHGFDEVRSDRLMVAETNSQMRDQWARPSELPTLCSMMREALLKILIPGDTVGSALHCQGDLFDHRWCRKGLCPRRADCYLTSTKASRSRMASMPLPAVPTLRCSVHCSLMKVPLWNCIPCRSGQATFPYCTAIRNEVAQSMCREVSSKYVSTRSHPGHHAVSVIQVIGAVC